MTADLPDHAARVSRAGCGELGYGATRGRAFTRPFHGVLTETGAPLGVVELAFACSLVLPQESWFSHSTAASLHRLPLPRALEGGALHVTVPSPRRAPRRRGVVGHARHWPVPAFGETLVDSSTGEPLPLRVEDPAVVLFSCSELLDLPNLVALGDAILLLAAPGVRETWSDLLAVSARRAGGARFQRALPLLREGVRSRAESLLRLQIREAGLPEPVVAHPISGDGWLQHPDLAWPEFRVLIEYEGDEHRTSPRRFASDIRRMERYDDAAWSALRLTRRDVYVDPDGAMARIESRLRRAGWRSPRRWSRRATLRVIP